MSKGKPKYDNLPKHQKKIVLSLAKEGPMIISETNKRIKGEYSSTNRAFHELETKEMIRKGDVKLYRGRRFPKYWLTVRGSAFALLNNANPENVRLNAIRFSERDADKRGVEAYFKLREIGPEIANVLDRFMLHVGKLEPTDLYKQLLPKMFSMSEDRLEELWRVGKETEYWKYFEEALKKFTDEVGRVLSHG